MIIILSILSFRACQGLSKLSIGCCLYGITKEVLGGVLSLCTSFLEYSKVLKILSFRVNALANSLPQMYIAQRDSIINHYQSLAKQWDIGLLEFILVAIVKKKVRIQWRDFHRGMLFSAST